jgi:signal transduction histidine kinase
MALPKACLARGDDHCHFIMANPSKIEGLLDIQGEWCKRITIEMLSSPPLRILLNNGHPEVSFGEREKPEKKYEKRINQLVALNNSLMKEKEEWRQAEEEKEQLQALLLKAQKMETLGTLAGGIAHDFNNLLMGIQANISLMLLSTDMADPHRERLKRIEDQIRNGGKLTAQLLGYARGGRYESLFVNLNELVDRTLEILARTKKEISIYRDFSQDLLAVEAEEGQIEQVLLNLYINAADAMESCGDLIIKTMNVTHEEMRDRPYSPKPGNYVMLTVTDTGIGMGKKTLEKIFDPFFTTKEMGRGTGLGLASVYGIIKGHGGYIDVESEMGKGSSFKIYLPASDRFQERELSGVDEIVPGEGTILLVDDEETILQAGEELLESMGYRVLTARSGKEAVETVKKVSDDIDLVLLDLIMPQMGGREAYEQLKDIDQQIKVVVMTGHNGEGLSEEMLAKGCNAFIEKPFTVHELSMIISNVLEMK